MLCGVRIELLRVAVPAVDRVHDRTGGQRIADARDRADSGAGKLGCARGQFRVQGVGGEARADDDQRAARQARRGIGELVGEGYLAGGERRDARQRVQRDAVRRQHAVDLRLLVAHDRPRRGMAGGRHVAHGVAAFGELLGEHAAHVVVVEVVDHDRSLERGPGGDVIRGEDSGTFAPGRPGSPAASTAGAPSASRWRSTTWVLPSSSTSSADRRLPR